MTKLNPRWVAELVGIIVLVAAIASISVVAGAAVGGLALILEANYGDPARSTDEEE